MMRKNGNRFFAKIVRQTNFAPARAGAKGGRKEKRASKGAPLSPTSR
jgi:hypothetical protein